MSPAYATPLVEDLRDRYRCFVPGLSFCAHTTPMPDEADLSHPPVQTPV